MMKSVQNGPNIYPGANFVGQYTNGRMKMIDLNSLEQQKRILLSYNLLSTSTNEQKIVYRHVVNGDVVLLNRQPTLHRPR
jgi:DNA-directed RNA polymerase I subunit RPA1